MQVAFAAHGNDSGRLYLPKEHVRLHQDQILVGYGNAWVPISNLAVDERGMYTTDKDASLFQWECPHCHYENFFWEDTCGRCGYER